MNSNAAARETASCGHLGIARDFLKPLERMTPIQEPPTSGQLPFAPRGMRFATDGSGLIAGGGLVGFSLDDEAIQQVRHLNWIVETRLAKVNDRGEVVSRLGVKRRRVGSIEGNSIDPFLHRVSGDPAFYRVDISFFRRGTNHLLGEYSTYARVVRPRVDLRVVAETATVAPGEVARAKLINLGTVSIESVAYDYGFNVEAFTGGGWITVPENPLRGRVPKRMQILPPGTENRGCLRYLVPADQLPGLYRFVGPMVSRVGHPLVAQFEVKP